STTIFISDPVLGANYSLNPADKTAIRLPVPKMAALPVMPPGSQIKVRVGVGALTAGVSVVPSLGGQPVVIYKNSVAGPGPNPPLEEQLGTKVVEGVQAEARALL